ncbi:hypothetical protein B0H14DRAFT_3474624 [Mycena olivaceomarginata]|nr:hypothetical protein B0H14DRAFT_3474624 [Mycena olivaceomarginata]
MYNLSHLITGKGEPDPATKASAPTPPTHPPSKSALEVDNPQNTTPAKTRKVEHTDDSSSARNQRILRSPEDRIATRKSSLPSGSSLNATDDPFSLGYQLAHRTQGGLVTHSMTPLAFTEEEELEEGELSQDTEQVQNHIPLHNARLTVHVLSQLPHGLGQRICPTTPDPSHQCPLYPHHSPL